MHTAFLFARRIAALGLIAFDPPHAVRHRAAFVTPGVTGTPATGDAGLHGARPH